MKVSYEENCGYCVFSPSIYLHLDLWEEEEVSNVIISKCCQKAFSKDAIAVVPFDEFLKIENIYGYLSSIYNIEPPNWNPSTNPDNCKGKTVCHYGQFPADKLLDVDVSVDVHCNINCSFCGFFPVREKAYKTKVQDIYFKILEKLKGNNLRNLYLTSNGEPFFFKERTFQFLESLAEGDFSAVSLHTNGTLLDKSDLDRLLKIKTPLFINFSLNAWDRESYIRVCGFDYFDKVLENLSYFSKQTQNLDNFDVHASFVITREEDWDISVDFITKQSQLLPNVMFTSQFDINKRQLIEKHSRLFMKNGKLL